MTTSARFLGLAALGLVAILGCKDTGSTSASSNPSTPTATTLAYVDPTAGTYLLKKNTTLSTTSHLVLDLVGPAATTGSGISATFSADTAKVTWTNVSALDPANTLVQGGGTFNLGSAPQILKGKVVGSTLQVAAAQKGIGSPVSLNGPLLRIALDLKASQATGAVAFSAPSANHQSQLLDATGNLVDITVTVGTLTAQ